MIVRFYQNLNIFKMCESRIGRYLCFADLLNELHEIFVQIDTMSNDTIVKLSFISLSILKL